MTTISTPQSVFGPTSSVASKTFHELNNELLQISAGSAACEVLRMLLKSKTYVQFESRVFKGFTPISSSVKLANGSTPYQARNAVLRLIAHNFYSIRVAAKNGSRITLTEALSSKQLRLDPLLDKLEFINTFLRSH